MKKCLLSVFFILFLQAVNFAAVGCDLNDPDRDARRIFPQQTSYKTTYFSVKDKGGVALQAKIEQRLGDKFQGLFENADVPYTLYTVYKGREMIGYIHGVNQKGEFGGIQVFLALSPSGSIEDIYFQKITSLNAAKFRDKTFAAYFKGLTLMDFYGYDVISHKATSGSRLSGIYDPTGGASKDFYSILRAVKKNLILMDEFAFNNSHLKYFNQKEKTN